ncbi:hypothetical protein ANN_08639 [Periplaneta americana]|uniref:Uncharacterized protein n=1 Tax=Periplaneta americana TaxID=6978 RepID=A0ABQ8T2M4_PERAM|nr:hypothetical protein ANN_08639 [Periplaneta americana]
MDKKKRSAASTASMPPFFPSPPRSSPSPASGSSCCHDYQTGVVLPTGYSPMSVVDARRSIHFDVLSRCCVAVCLLHGRFQTPDVRHSDGTRFRRKIKRYNNRIWGSQNSHAVVQLERDSPKVNVFCVVSRRRVFDPLFFADNNVKMYLDILEN